MRVECEIIEGDLENEDGRPQSGIEVHCDRCGHYVEVFGCSIRSIKRGCVMLREECPMDEDNFYVMKEFE